MYYVSSKSITDGKFGVTDTDDGVEEFYSKEQLLKLVQSKKVEIDGVSNDTVCVVKTTNETMRLFKSSKYHLAVSTMTTSNSSFGLRFKSKPTGGEMRFVKHQVLNISRSDVNSFSYDLGYSKSYRSGLTLDDMLMVIEQFSKWTLETCILGRL